MVARAHVRAEDDLEGLMGQYRFVVADIGAVISGFVGNEPTGAAECAAAGDGRIYVSLIPSSSSVPQTRGASTPLCRRHRNAGRAGGRLSRGRGGQPSPPWVQTQGPPRVFKTVRLLASSSAYADRVRSGAHHRRGHRPARRPRWSDSALVTGPAALIGQVHACGWPRQCGSEARLRHRSPLPSSSTSLHSVIERVLLASDHRGFCASGVDMAIKALFWMIQAFGPPVYCFPEIIHNQKVVSRASKTTGVIFVDDISRGARGRAQRCCRPTDRAPEVVQTARDRGVYLVDSVCQLVSNSPVTWSRLARPRRAASIVYVGHEDHHDAVGHSMADLPGRRYTAWTMPAGWPPLPEFKEPVVRPGSDKRLAPGVRGRRGGDPPAHP